MSYYRKGYFGYGHLNPGGATLATLRSGTYSWLGFYWSGGSGGDMYIWKKIFL